MNERKKEDKRECEPETIGPQAAAGRSIESLPAGSGWNRPHDRLERWRSINELRDRRIHSGAPSALPTLPAHHRPEKGRRSRSRRRRRRRSHYVNELQSRWTGTDQTPPPPHLSILQRGNHPRNDVRGTAMPLMCSRPIVVRPPRNDMIITSSGSENEILGKKK